MTRVLSFNRGVLGSLLALCMWASLAPSLAAQSLIRDTEIEEILRDYSDPIIRAAGLNTGSVDIYIVNDPDLNAFVTRGQNMFFHTGLILEAETPNQLKGVIAHETGHIAGGHLVRSDYGTRSAYGATLIAMGVGIAAILAGEGQAGAIILGGSSQFGALEILAYSRTNEAAADQYAAQYMERTKQSGKGLIGFFEKFRYQEVLSNARRYSYFRSHPLSSDRIDSLREVVDESPYRDTPDTPEDIRALSIMKAKLRGFLEAPQIVFTTYPETDTTIEARYARAVAHFRSANLSEALAEIDSLLDEVPDNPYFHELKAQIYHESGKGELSIAPLERAIELKPNAPLFEIALAQSLIETDDTDSLNRAVALIKSALQIERQNNYAWFLLAQAYGRLNEPALAKYATAEQAFNSGDYSRAQSFARRAQQDLERNSPQWRRASDIIVVSETQLMQSKNKRQAPKPLTISVQSR